MFKEGIGVDRRGIGTDSMGRRGGAKPDSVRRRDGIEAGKMGRCAADPGDIPARLPCGMRAKGSMCGMPEKGRAGMM
jgi:hypothetical protein